MKVQLHLKCLTVLFIVISISIPASRGICVGSTPLYVGETRLIVRPAYKTAGVHNVEMGLADFANIASSITVLNRSRDSLAQLGVSLNPYDVLRNLKIEPVPDTQILSIKVTSTDPQEAKSAVDVVACEVKRFYKELQLDCVSESRKLLQEQLKRAEAKLATVEKNGKDDNKNDISSAREECSILRVKLAAFPAKDTAPYIVRTMSPGYVYPAPPDKRIAIFFKLLVGCSVGGIVVGLFFGFILGRWSVKRKHHS